MNEAALAKRISLLLHHQLDCFAFARNDGDCIQINKKDKKEVFLQSAIEHRPERIGKNNGAGEGNRTLVFSLEGCCSTIELHPRTRKRRDVRAYAKPRASRQAEFETTAPPARR